MADGRIGRTSSSEPEPHKRQVDLRVTCCIFHRCFCKNELLDAVCWMCIYRPEKFFATSSGHTTETPPSIRSDCPLMKDACSLHRKFKAFAESSAWPMRRSGTSRSYTSIRPALLS